MGRRRRSALLAAVVVVLASCGDDGPDRAAAEVETTMDPGMDMADADGHAGEHDREGYEFGAPAEAADAARVIEIVARDDLSFDPASVTVAVGDIVTFRVTNAGVLPHDFTLGDEHLQEEHDAEMAEMSAGEMAMHNEANAFMIEPGATMEMTWLLTEPGEILYGCHTPGHYAAGMRGTITVEG